MRTVVRWPDAAKARVAQLWLAREMPACQIAAVISAEHGIAATKSAVIGIAHRAGLSYKGRLATSPIQPRRIGPPPKRVRKPRPRADAAPKPAPAPRPRPAPALPAPVPMSLRIPLVEIKDGSCRFIADDPKAAPATCCGHPTASGSPWCDGHRAVCTVPTGARASAWIPSFRTRRAA
ncbi:GcrA family cell cycle regulator [Methylorubrum salsuginis]|uniref:GcrA cell cycle regulator n=1 Tax=Methylorubrum salsuginis TaxID=414703 RepID=A0A1I4E382_9HYPH|nr:GcrA family cell cycle regulator [Methylorubrum salsuginis]SFL00264.1 GcrA cell cycle regulator [Methylorubrum salsuginis]